MKEFNFLEGNCFNFTIALHRLYNLRLVLLYGERQFSLIESETVCIHTLALTEDGKCIDIEGIKDTPEILLQVFIKLNDPYSKTEIFYFEDEASFWHYVLACGGFIDEEAIKKAQDIIKTSDLFSFLKNNP